MGTHLLRNIIATLAIAAIIPALTGCRAGKSTSKGMPEGPIPAEITLQTPAQRYKALCAGYGEWQDVSLPVKVTLTEPKSVGFSARATMKRNEWISLSVRMLGFELASVWIDNDSVHAVDKYHKLYLSESVNKIFAGAGVSIGNIQDLLMGRGFLTGSTGGTFTEALASLLNMQPSPDGLIIIPVTDKDAELKYGFMLSPQANNLLVASIEAGAGHAGTVVYPRFAETPAGMFATTANLAVVGKKAKATIDWNFSSAKWNSGAKRSWKHPTGYKRISAEKLLKSLSSM